MANAGIYGIGTYLPPNVRTNDWWPASLVESWKRAPRTNLVRPEHDAEEPDTEGVRLAREAMAKVRDDPFKGAIERRVMPEGMVSSDMEIAAGREALQRAGVDPNDVGLLMTSSQLPDYLVVSTASHVHRELGINQRCLSMGTDWACNGFLMQATLAEQMIRSKQVRFALLIQSAGVAHISDPRDHHSVWYGDGATAVVLGPVDETFGILGRSHRTDGSYYRGLVGGCPGSRWYKGSDSTPHPILYVEDRVVGRRMLLKIADLAKQSVLEALADAGLSVGDVDFYASHQSTAWFRETTQRLIGLHRARGVDTYTWTGSLGAANIPYMMATAEREGQLRAGDVVAMHTGGSGITWSGMVLRYGH